MFFLSYLIQIDFFKLFKFDLSTRLLKDNILLINKILNLINQKIEVIKSQEKKIYINGNIFEVSKRWD